MSSPMTSLYGLIFKCFGRSQLQPLSFMALLGAPSSFLVSMGLISSLDNADTGQILPLLLVLDAALEDIWFT